MSPKGRNSKFLQKSFERKRDPTDSRGERLAIMANTFEFSIQKKLGGWADSCICTIPSITLLTKEEVLEKWRKALLAGGFIPGPALDHPEIFDVLGTARFTTKGGGCTSFGVEWVQPTGLCQEMFDCIPKGYKIEVLHREKDGEVEVAGAVAVVVPEAEADPLHRHYAVSFRHWVTYPILLSSTKVWRKGKWTAQS